MPGPAAIIAIPARLAEWGEDLLHRWIGVDLFLTIGTVLSIRGRGGHPYRILTPQPLNVKAPNTWQNIKAMLFWRNVYLSILRMFFWLSYAILNFLLNTYICPILPFYPLEYLRKGVGSFQKGTEKLLIHCPMAHDLIKPSCEHVMLVGHFCWFALSCLSCLGFA